MTQLSKQPYAVYAEAEGHPRPLIQTNLSFGRLMDDIVVPYHSGDAFFVDGVSITQEKLKRIKILSLTDKFAQRFAEFNFALTHGDVAKNKVYGEQYFTRFEHLLRENSTDVTAQVVKAYSQVIKPSLKDYLPKREELISTALKIFIEGLKTLNS